MHGYFTPKNIVPNANHSRATATSSGTASWWRRSPMRWRKTGAGIEEMLAKVESAGYDGKKRRPSRLRFFPAVARRQQFSRDLQNGLSFGGEKLYNILQRFILGRAGPVMSTNSTRPYTRGTAPCISGFSVSGVTPPRCSPCPGRGGRPCAASARGTARPG